MTVLELAFATKSLRLLCESEADAKRDLGEVMAEHLKRRLADLRAATKIRDIVAGRLHDVGGTGHGQKAVDLSEGHHLVFCANHPTNPALESGDVDWSRVRRIKLLRIEKKNG